MDLPFLEGNNINKQIISVGVDDANMFLNSLQYHFQITIN